MRARSEALAHNLPNLVKLFVTKANPLLSAIAKYHQAIAERRNPSILAFQSTEGRRYCHYFTIRPSAKSFSSEYVALKCTVMRGMWELCQGSWCNA